MKGCKKAFPIKKTQKHQNGLSKLETEILSFRFSDVPLSQDLWLPEDQMASETYYIYNTIPSNPVFYVQSMLAWNQTQNDENDNKRVKKKY